MTEEGSILCIKIKFMYSDVPGSPCLSKTGPVYDPFLFLNFWVVLLGSLALCLVAAWNPGGLLETPPRWQVTVLLNYSDMGVRQW